MNNESDSSRPLWRQPLVHFLVAGAAIFAFNEFRGPSEPTHNKRIVVTVAAVERMAGLWQKSWGRPPSDAELQALVRDYIKEEIYYREALKLGLDINDTVIRRRLRQKMEFLTTDADPIDPDDQALRTFFEENAEKYRKSPEFDFEQVYFSTGDTGRIAAALETLRSGSGPEHLGDAISLPSAMTGADEARIARTFGSEFYAQLQSLQSDVWSGPVTSGFGRHLVKIGRLEPERLLSFEEAVKTVENDWRAAQRIASLEAVFQQLRGGYEIEIEAPQ